MNDFIFNEVADLQPPTLLKTELLPRYISGILASDLGTPFLKSAITCLLSFSDKI